MTDYETEGAGLIPDVIAKVFALIHQLPKNQNRFFARTFCDFSEEVAPGTSYRGRYLESLKVPAER